MSDRVPRREDDVESVTDADASEHKFRISRSLQFGKQLPHDILPPDTIERLRAGGELSPAELAIVQSAALRDAGPLGQLLHAALSRQAEASSSTDASVDALAAGVPADGSFLTVPGSERTFVWQWPGKPGRDVVEREPATYYEALTGKRDPDRNFFITARRAINLLVSAIALGLPIGLTALAIVTGQSLETIVFVGIGASIVGMMIRSSFPRTPFG